MPQNLKITQKTAAAKAAALRVPSVPRLRVRRPHEKQVNSCLSIMTSVLSCWASVGYNTQGCAAFETALRTCMDKPRPKNTKKNDINMQLSRMYGKIMGPRKRT